MKLSHRISGARLAHTLLLAGIASCSGGGGSGGVVPPVVTLTSLEITPTSDSLAVGQSRQFALTGHYSDGSTSDLTVDAVWSSSAAAVASVENGLGNAGHALALSVGDTLVRGTFSTFHAEALLHVTPAVAVQVVVTPSAIQLPLDFGQALVATATFTDASVLDVTGQCVWASSDRAVVEVGTTGGDAGVLHSLAAGVANVTATLDGQIGAAAVEVIPVDVLEHAVPGGAVLDTPRVALAGSGTIDAVWAHTFADPGELYLSHFDPTTGWTPAELYDTSSLGDRTFGPEIAVSGIGLELFAWHGRTGIYAASRSPDGTTSAPAVIASGPSPFLDYAPSKSLRADALGRGLLVWVNDNSDTIRSARFLPHAGWSPPVIVRVVPQFTQCSGRGLRLAMNDAGAAFLLWSEGSVVSSWRIYAARFDPIGGWGSAQLLDDLPAPDPFDVAINASGSAMATWTDVGSFFPTTLLYAARHEPGQGWLAPEMIADTNRPSDPTVALATNGNAFVEWRNAFDFDVVGNRYVSGVGWQGGQVLVDIALGDPTPLKAYMNDAGDIVAFWVRSSIPARLEYRRYDSASGWQPLQAVDFLGFSGVANGLGLSTDPTGRSVLTWVEDARNPDVSHACAYRFQVP